MVAEIFDDAMLPEPASSHLPLRKVFAVGLGNALEFYDFVTFSFFAIQIGHSFFPASETSHGLLYSLATFGVGFLTRPLGGLVIGRYADRVGRQPAMMLSFGLMGVGIAGLALTPSYARIGIAAPIMLVLFRLVQGFALGGEVGPSTAYLIEAAPPARRGIYVALQYGTQDAAVLAAGIVGFVLSTYLDPAALDSWGWRVAFLIGLTVVPVGLMIRRSLPETLHAADVAPAAAPPARTGRIFVLGLAMLGSMTITVYVLDYMTTYAQDVLHMSVTLAFGATIVGGLASMVADILGGLLSDRVGRKPVMLTAAVLLLALMLPAYIVMVRFPSAIVVYVAVAVLNALGCFQSGPAITAITESFPKAIRSGGLGTLYAVAIATFGGTAQFIIKYLGDVSGSKLAPAYYVSVALVIGFVAMLFMRETAPCKTRGT